MKKQRFLKTVILLLLVFMLSASPSEVLASTSSIKPLHNKVDNTAKVNLSHLNSLHTTIPYPNQPAKGHSTVDPQKPLDIWWVYSNLQKNGGYKSIGGGNYDPTTNTWGQGVSDTDDLARIAIVYLKHYKNYHDTFSLKMSYKVLRTVMYLQINSGPDKGNFVNWIEPNGQPNLNPTPSEDTGSTFDWWAARSLWAMAEGYHVYRTIDPSFANKLRERIELAIGSLNTQVANKYGEYYNIHGYKLPKWLISDGSDASSVATLGLVQYYNDTKNAKAKKLLKELATGIKDSRINSPQNQWPYNAHMPWQKSIDLWEAWGNRQIMALAEAGQALKETQFIKSAKAEANSLYPHMIISYGPDNGWEPAPDNLTQISYGAESMIDSLLTLSRVSQNQIYAKEAGILATWYLGNNRAQKMMYHSQTGVTYDGINNDKTVNKNSGAESTLTALLALMNVENNTVSNTFFSYHTRISKTRPMIINGSSGTPSGGAIIKTAPQQWSGDFLWRNGKFGQLVPGSNLNYTVKIHKAGVYLIQLSFDKQPVPVGKVGVKVFGDNHFLGMIDQGGAGLQGDSPTADYLWMHMLTKPVHFSKGVHKIRLSYSGQKGHIAKIDALVVQPMIERETLQNSALKSITISHNMLNNHLSIH